MSGRKDVGQEATDSRTGQDVWCSVDEEKKD